MVPSCLLTWVLAFSDSHISFSFFLYFAVLLFRYSLFAVVIHSGTLEVGHYMCYVRQEKDQVVLGINLLFILILTCVAHQNLPCLQTINISFIDNSKLISFF